MSEINDAEEETFEQDENFNDYFEEFDDEWLEEENVCEETYVYDEESDETEVEEEETDEFKKLCTKDSFKSILTCITPDTSYTLSYEGVCLHMYDESDSAMNGDSYDFEPNKKGDIVDYYGIVENDDKNGLDKYADECFKYGIPRIGAVIECLKGETVLNLKHYGLGTIGVQFALDVFCGPPVVNITHIDLTNSPFSESACYPLNDFMTQSYTLEYLNLSNCNIGTKGIEILAEGIEFSPSIKTLNLSRCNLQDPGGGIVAQALAHNEVCKAVDLSTNYLGPISGVNLGAMLVKNDVLELLELGWNNLFPQKEACIPLMKGLSKNLAIKKIGLTWNGLSGKLFATNLRKAIISNTTLEILDLQNNRLSGIEMKLIATAVKKSESLQYLYIGGNTFSADDFMILLKIFNAPVTLIYLDLGDQQWLTQDAARLANNAMGRVEKLKILFKGILMNNPPEPVNTTDIIFDRCMFLTMKPKKKKLKKEFGHLMHILLDHEQDTITIDEFETILKQFKSNILLKDTDLVKQLEEIYLIKVSAKSKKKPKIKIKEMAKYYLDRHPTERRPPPPPPKAKKKKGAGKKKKK